MRALKRKVRLWAVFVLLLGAFSFPLWGTAVAGGGGTPESQVEGTHESVAGGAHEETAGEAHAGDRTGDLLDLLYRFINFALLVIILFVALRKSGLKQSLRGRIEDIRQRLEELRREKQEAEARYKEIERELKAFEAKKKELFEQFRREGEAEKARIIAEAEERARQIVAQAELTVQHEIQAAAERLRGQVVALATQRAGEMIAKELKAEDQERLVKEFIEKVEKIH